MYAMLCLSCFAVGAVLGAIVREELLRRRAQAEMARRLNGGLPCQHSKNAHIEAKRVISSRAIS